MAAVFSFYRKDSPMDFDSTLESIVSVIPEDVDLGNALKIVFDFLPEESSFNNLLSEVQNHIPAQIDFLTASKFLLIFGVGSLLLGILGRLILGKRSSLNHSVSSVMGILFLYAMTIIIYTFKPWNLTELLSPLPFMVFGGDCLILITLQSAPISVLCHEILSLVILSFLVNLLDTIIPKGKGIISWYMLRFLTILLAMALHILTDWAFDTYLPDVLVTYAPVILLGVLAAMLLIGVLNLVLGTVLAIVDPIMGAIYTFFFSNIIGKQLSKAVVTTIILCGLFFVMGYFGYTLIGISLASLLTYVPAGLVMLILWYLIGHIL